MTRKKQHQCNYRDCNCILVPDRDDCWSKELHKCNHPKSEPMTNTKPKPRAGEEWEKDFLSLLDRPKGNFSDKNRRLLDWVKELVRTELLRQRSEIVGEIEEMKKPTQNRTTAFEEMTYDTGRISYNQAIKEVAERVRGRN